jgi:hypothetical protein
LATSCSFRQPKDPCLRLRGSGRMRLAWRPSPSSGLEQSLPGCAVLGDERGGHVVALLVASGRCASWMTVMLASGVG